MKITKKFYKKWSEINTDNCLIGKKYKRSQVWKKSVQKYMSQDEKQKIEGCG